jgi:PAS domain S-box-containing protein
MFRLLRYFLITSAIAFIVATLSVTYVFRQSAVDKLVKLAERQNMVLAQSLTNALWPQFASYVRGASDLDGDTLRARSETRQIDLAIKNLTAGLMVLNVKIYHSGGLTVYASQADRMGRNEAEASGFLVTARQGRPSSSLTFRETLRSIQGVVHDRNLVESYLPIRVAGGPVEGVFELYSDVTPLMADIGKSTLKFSFGLFLAFAALYALLFLIIRRADRILTQQYAALEQEIEDRKKNELSLRRLSSIVESSADAITAMTPSGIITDWNQSAEDVYGFTAEEVVGRHISIIAPPDRLDEIREFSEKTVQGNPIKRVETVRMRKDGTRLEIALSVAPIMDAAGNVVTLTGIHRDITEYKQADEALRENARMLETQYANLEQAHEERTRANQLLAQEIAERMQIEERLTKQTQLLETTFEHMSDGISVLDADHNLAAFNTKYLELWDFPPDFIQLGMTCEAIACFRAERGDYGAGDVETYVAARALAKQKCEILSNEITLPNGKIISLNANPMPDGGYVSTHTDITDLKRAEAALQKAHDEMENQVAERTAQLSAVLASAVTGIITIDSQGIVLSFNPAAERMFGYAADEVISRNISMLMPERDAVEHDAFLAGYHSDQKSRVLARVRQITGRRRDGSKFPMDLSVGKMVVDGNISFVGNLTDISERLEQEYLLHHSQKMESLGQLTGGVAHEFNNLLTVINGFAELGKLKADDIKMTRGYFAEIIKAAGQASGLTRQMLAFSRTEIVERRLTPVGETINGLAPMLKPLVGSNIDLRMELSDPEIHAIVDPGQLSQAILNLAINGCHAMPDGGELVIGCDKATPSDQQMTLHPEMRDQRCIAVSVTDHGCGIPDKILPQIFNPFFTTKETGKGTGLGLSMVYGMAEQSGGFVDVKTEVGKGTTFSIYLPLAELSEDTPEVAGWTGTVLIVEGKAGVREIAGETLEALGHDVLTAENGVEAEDLFRAQSGKIDLLITDIALSDPSGPELTRLLMAGNPDLKVIFLSIDAAPDAAAGADLQNVSKFLQKPIDRYELNRIVGELFEGVNEPPVSFIRRGNTD